MTEHFFEQPILNSPYAYSARHWELDPDGQPTDRILDFRRLAKFVTPVPKPKRRRQSSAPRQVEMVFDEGLGLSTAEQQYDPTSIINAIRDRVDQWRRLPESSWQVTPETARLLKHWREHPFQSVRPFYCQVEAVETAIWLAEVAPQSRRYDDLIGHLQRANEQSNPELYRVALKLATGSGKTTVMAMLIAWQTVNAVRHPQSKRFTRGFLIVTPGITIKDRLRVLQPNDPDSYYRSRELVPTDMLPDIDRAKIVITNYHAFKLRERMPLASGTRALLQGRGGDLQTLETEGQMLQRVMPDLMGMKNILVLNDEAHHCYREKPQNDDMEELKGDERQEAQRNNKAARLWISGLEIVKRKLGAPTVYDLSATPFFLSGSGYAEGTLFPWVVSDFSLMDAIECGIVKLPRVPVADNVPGGDMPKFRNLWEHIGKKMPKKGRGAGHALDPLSLPAELQTALDALYGHYAKTYELWEQAGIRVPPVFIVVCNNTATSKLVHDFIAGFHRVGEDGETETYHAGRLPLFRNYDEHGNRLARPRTLLIDSQQLESGEALDPDFRAMAGDEIERFRREIVERSGNPADGQNISDQDLLREVMNTVGKPGRLGESVRCVVSVAMLTEGWDANTVTHVLGVRAFGTQLLCEQVVGRALRRQSYDLNEAGLFNVEYADVLGIPFDFTAQPQVKTFRDTWRDSIHSYLTYLRDRLTVARDLLADSGSIFVQIGDENVHRVRALIDEVFGEDNLCSQLTIAKTASQTSQFIAGTSDYILWYAKNIEHTKYRPPLLDKSLETDKSGVYRWVRESNGSERQLTDQERSEGNTQGVFRLDNITSQRPPGSFPVTVNGRVFGPGKGYWKTGEIGMLRLVKANRIKAAANSLTYVRFINDFRAQAIGNVWSDTGTGSFTDEKIYVVQSGTKAVARCVLMTTDPGDLVLDPTCGSGTTAYVAEQWGRRWITIDTSRVALALARARIMGARYPYYLLADSPAGQLKEAEVTRTAPSSAPTYGNLRHGFVYERVPHITLKSIANNAEIDVIWDKHQETLEPLRARLNAALGKAWQEWEIPREADKGWPAAAHELHAAWWQARIARQKEIDASIAAKAEFEYLYDKPYEDKSIVRVAGPFTVETLSPHRVLAVDENDELIPHERFINEGRDGYGDGYDFTAVILENLKTAGVQQAHKEDRITFTALTPWPGRYICAEGRYQEGESGKERRAGIFIGPEFGTVPRADLVAAAREAGDAGFDVLIACAFNYDAHSAEFERLGRVPILKARMNADLHMADTLKSTGAGNLFVIFGEPDIAIQPASGGQIQVTIRGVDVFRPQSGEVQSSSPDEIACWFIDTDYNEESFFVRQAYFLGANDPYKALKTTLKAEVDEEAWASLYGDTSRPFDKPSSGRIAVKVINHLGDEVMKVFSVA